MLELVKKHLLSLYVIYALSIWWLPRFKSAPWQAETSALNDKLFISVLGNTQLFSIGGTMSIWPLLIPECALILGTLKPGYPLHPLFLLILSRACLLVALVGWAFISSHRHTSPAGESTSVSAYVLRFSRFFFPAFFLRASLSLAGKKEGARGKERR